MARRDKAEVRTESVPFTKAVNPEHLNSEVQPEVIRTHCCTVSVRISNRIILDIFKIMHCCVHSVRWRCHFFTILFLRSLRARNVIRTQVRFSKLLLYVFSAY
jgi:hypothetical protein